MAGPSFAGDRSRQQDRCVSFLKLDPPPIQCAARVNSLLTEQSSYNFNSVISFSTFTRRTAYSWQRVQFETTTPAHLLASSVPSETRTRQLVSRALTEAALGSGVALVPVSKIKLAFRPTAVFSTDFHQQVTLFTVAWGRKVKLVLD